MLGFGDAWVAAAYVLCLLSAILCVVYGLMHWNDDDDQDVAFAHPAAEELEFEEEN